MPNKILYYHRPPLPQMLIQFRWEYKYSLPIEDITQIECIFNFIHISFIVEHFYPIDLPKLAKIFN